MLGSSASPAVIAAIPRLRKLVRERAIDCIHAQTRVAQVAGSAAAAAEKVPLVTTCHGYFTPKLGRRFVPGWGARVIAVSEPVRDHLVRDFGVDRHAVTVTRNLEKNTCCPLRQVLTFSDQGSHADKII